MVYSKQGPHYNSDESLQWEDFFGTSVDISSSLLDMYDTLVSNTRSALVTSNFRVPQSECLNAWDQNSSAVGQQPRVEVEGVEKKRPLSVSSLSSSSSSSSSSLPRNALDVKRSYLASIESLDDEYSEDGDLALASKCLPVLAESKWERNPSHIERVLAEIVETERTYVSDLQKIIRGYMHHVNAGLSEENMRELFGNIEDICEFNSTLLADLEQCALDAVAIARCFVQHGTGFEIYTQYCTNYPRTVAVLTDLMRNQDTAEILKARQRALHHSLPLGSYLLKPVQRILKYHLLLQNIVLHMENDGATYIDMKNALSVMTGIAYHINEMKRKHEHAVRVQEIQSLLYGWQGHDLTTYGELVAEGSFRMLGAKALRHIFLFDKLLLVAKKKEEGILIYKAHIMCSDLMLIESIRGEPLCFHVIPFSNPRMQFTFQARNVDQKREWCLQLKQVILENYNAVIPSHARQLVLQLGQSRSEDGGRSEKSSTRRHLSAPEYLERRRHERRKFGTNSSRSSLGKSADNKVLGRRVQSCHQEGSSDDQNLAAGENWSIGPQLSELESGTEERSSRVRRGRIRRTWNGLAEETTDTENEDPFGEYVMFYFPRGRSYPEPALGRRSAHCTDPPSLECSAAMSSSSEAAVGRTLPESAIPQRTVTEAASRRQNGAVRRVQSFTGLARAKVAASLHHTFSFCSTPLRSRGRCAVATTSLSETTPAWLESDDNSTGKKSDSLPRSFRPGSDSGEENKSSVAQKTTVVPQKQIQNGLEANNVVHPEHKIYFRPSLGRAVVKNLISTVGSRFALFRSSHVPVRRVSSKSSIWSDGDLGKKNIGNKLMQSISWMYSAKSKGLRPSQKCKMSETVSDSSSAIYRTNSFSLGARMAQPLESEYCVPSSLLCLSGIKPLDPDSNRPSSLLSETSENVSIEQHPLLFLNDSDQNEDSLSDNASETSADSYYERTFEAIESVLTEDMFRDSAIYSDPEDADLSATEAFSFTKPEVLSERIEQVLLASEVGEGTALSVQEKRVNLQRWCADEDDVGRPGHLEGTKNRPTLMKGWVKHVVSKLQGDSP